MAQVFSVTKTKKVPSFRQWKQLSNVISKTESNILTISISLIILSMFALLGLFATSNRIEIPTLGGEYTEALVGEPQFINPLYASSNDVDADIASLIYSGLLKLDPNDGLTNDLASEININEDQTVYTITIRDDAKFHNGDEVMARDVVFTINAIQNSSYRSPLAHKFKDVSIVQEDDKIISFILESSNVNFKNALTTGILPAGLWAEILPQNTPLAALNLQPIGSGPYKFLEFTKDKKGSILSYTLKAYSGYYNESAKLQNLTFKFYPDTFAAFDALKNKHVEGINLVPFTEIEDIQQNKNLNIHQPYIPKQTTLFFNQKTNETLKDLSVRSAIAASIDKTGVLNDVLKGNERISNTPLLPGQYGYDELLKGIVFDLAKANSTLDEAGYKLAENKIRLLKNTEIEKKEDDTEDVNVETDASEENNENTTAEEIKEDNKTLSFTLTTIDSEEYILVAKKLKEQIEQTGIKIEIITVPSEIFFSEIIETRNFELLLSAIMMDQNANLTPFWHSSKSQTGLNVTDYKNDDVDILLDELKETTDETKKIESLRKIQEQILLDIPAVFLYQSAYTYATPKKIQNVIIESITQPSDRFMHITDWYLKTKKVFK